MSAAPASGLCVASGNFFRRRLWLAVFAPHPRPRVGFDGARFIQTFTVIPGLLARAEGRASPWEPQRTFAAVALPRAMTHEGPISAN